MDMIAPRLRTLFLIALLACWHTPLHAAPSENRAAKLYEWYERGEWFEFPAQFMADGSPMPTIGSGMLIPHPKKEPQDQLYLHDLQFQAGVVSRCGPPAVDVSLQKLRSPDPYIALVAALALDGLLGTELGIELAHGRMTLAEAEKTYRSRADLCFPKR